MKMKKNETAVVVTGTKAMSNGRVKLNRVVKNLFLMLFGKDKKIAGVDELKVEGCFSRIQKEKDNLAAIMKSQKNAIGKRKEQARADTEKADVEIAEIKKEILEKEEKLQDKLATIEGENAEIALEMERCDRVCKRMDDFFA